MMPKKILIVDDDQAIIHVLSVLLTRAGYAVVSAQNGQESLAVLTMQQVDLVVLDIMLSSCTECRAVCSGGDVDGAR